MLLCSVDSDLFLQRVPHHVGHLGRRCALAGTSFQQVNPGWPCALLVLEIEEYILVEGEELFVPSAVLGRLLAQIAALGSFFTRDRRQKQRVALVVADALLHFVEALGAETNVEQSENRFDHREPMPLLCRGNFTTERRARLNGTVAHGKVAPLTEGSPQTNS